MLANGATLGVKVTAGATTYTNLPGLKEIPELGVEPEKVDNTCLTDALIQYEMGIGDAGDIEYVFKWDVSANTTAWRVLKPLEESGEAYEFQEKLEDGTTTTFSGQVALRRGGGGVNDPLEFTLSIALQSALTVAYEA